MARSRKTRKRKGSSGIGIFVLGIFVGSVGTALYNGVLRDTPSDIGSGIESLITAAKDRNESVQAQSEQANDSDQSLPNVTFNFHELLLEDEYILPQPRKQDQTVVPENESEPKQQQTPAPANTLSTYVLQVGSFNQYKDADRVKATLALNGLEAFVQKVTVEGRGDFYRVRLGPFDQLETMQEIGESLTKLGYQSLRFRLKNRG